ncbi:hypothetical protein PRIPAC_79136 [Pristionchus pacificus]|uniref:G protein-coupled receptor n=1 Tax=Pristionchus pacificus TaxID=54126 RepID=A0A2A6CJS8_PRIPA|nr:hypothetical protein PRIPAC_79136 [Pristionchus pacificus]|eukprot:PDM78370.1 G protein-coupled receptor [Pristionchus pacificus]
MIIHYESQAVLMYFDVVYNILMCVYALPPYGLFYCEAILCTVGLSKPIVIELMSSAIIMGVPVYIFLILRSHQMVVQDSTSRFNFSWKVQFAFMYALIVMLLANVGGFVLYSKDVSRFDELIKTPELSWLAARGGTLFLFGEPEEKSEFVNEMILFGATFSMFMPPAVFLTLHAMRVLKQTSLRTTSTKTHRISRNLFHVFRLQAFISNYESKYENFSCKADYFSSLILDIGAVVVDIYILPGSLFAAARFGTVCLFTLVPTQFGLIFILRNETHRAIIRKRLSRFLDRLLGTQAAANTKVMTTVL